MKFKDLFSSFISTERGSYIDIDTFKILQDNNENLDNVKKIPICPINLHIESLIKALDYYLISHQDEEQFIIEKKEELKNALKHYNNLANKDDFEQKEYKIILNTVNSICEDIKNIHMEKIEKYYKTLSYIEYVKDWCIDNDINLEKDSYEDYVEQYKYISGITPWQQSNRKNKKEFEKIADIKIPRKAKWLFLKFEDFRHLVFEEKIVVKKRDYNDDLSIWINNANWKHLDDIDFTIRCMLYDFLENGNQKHYLIYNLTEKKYNYYNENKKNELLIFILHSYDYEYHIWIKKMIF